MRDLERAKFYHKKKGHELRQKKSLMVFIFLKIFISEERLEKLKKNPPNP